jgi:hypothetical protein
MSSFKRRVVAIGIPLLARILVIGLVLAGLLPPVAASVQGAVAVLQEALGGTDSGHLGCARSRAAPLKPPAQRYFLGVPASSIGARSRADLARADYLSVSTCETTAPADRLNRRGLAGLDSRYRGSASGSVKVRESHVRRKCQAGMLARPFV